MSHHGSMCYANRKAQGEKEDRSASSGGSVVGLTSLYGVDFAERKPNCQVYFVHSLGVISVCGARTTVPQIMS